MSHDEQNQSHAICVNDPGQVSSPATSAEHVVAAARRVADTHRIRLNKAEHAFREWEHRPSLSNAIRRDDAKRALLDLSDANTLALAILQEADQAEKTRCPERSQEGARCIYEARHEGNHFAKDAFSYYSWETHTPAVATRKLGPAERSIVSAMFSKFPPPAWATEDDLIYAVEHECSLVEAHAARKGFHV